MKPKFTYPFTAIVGQEKVKKALLLNLIEPKISGVLLSGQKGTAKSTMIRSLDFLGNKKVINLPLNATEDCILGSINIERTLKTGIVAFEPGLLSRADQQILYIDEVNLLSSQVSNIILDTAACHVNHVEREGISHRHSSDFILIGSMNPEEGHLKEQLLDRFGFYVEVKGSQNKKERIEIIKNRLEFEENPEKFIKKYAKKTLALKEKLIQSRALYKTVKLPENILHNIGQICNETCLAGHRGDLALSLGAKAHAAFMGRNTVSLEDVEAVASYVITHRLRQEPSEEQTSFEDQTPTSNDDQENHQTENNSGDDQEFDNASEGDGLNQEFMDPNFSESEASQIQTEVPKEKHVFDIDENFQAKDIFSSLAKESLLRSGSGKRNINKSNTNKGRYIKYRLPKGKIKDIAFDATIRQAALFQKTRKKSDLFINIHAEDVREKVREDRVGNTILFLMDASGSMGVDQRMSLVKGAILSLLESAYQNRDTVGLMTFNGQRTHLILEPTRSIDLAYKKLQGIEIGGRTPLALGVKKSVEFIKSKKAKHKEIRAIVVIMSDGRNNVSLSNLSFVEELEKTAKEASKEDIKFIVIDSETGFLKFGLAQQMAEQLNASYLSLEELKVEKMVDSIKRMI